MAPPPYAKYLLAAASAGAFLAAYVGMKYPTAAFFIMAGVGTVNAFAAYLGWNTPT